MAVLTGLVVATMWASGCAFHLTPGVIGVGPMRASAEPVDAAGDDAAGVDLPPGSRQLVTVLEGNVHKIWKKRRRRFSPHLVPVSVADSAAPLYLRVAGEALDTYTPGMTVQAWVPTEVADKDGPLELTTSAPLRPRKTPPEPRRKRYKLAPLADGAIATPLSALKTGDAISGRVVAVAGGAAYVEAGVSRVGAGGARYPCRGTLKLADEVKGSLPYLSTGLVVDLYVKAVSLKSGLLSLTADRHVSSATLKQARLRKSVDKQQARGSLAVGSPRVVRVVSVSGAVATVSAGSGLRGTVRLPDDVVAATKAGSRIAAEITSIEENGVLGLAFTGLPPGKGGAAAAAEEPAQAAEPSSSQGDPPPQRGYEKWGRTNLAAEEPAQGRAAEPSDEGDGRSTSTWSATFPQ